MKKLTLATIAAFAALALAGCSSGGAVPASTSAAPGASALDGAGEVDITLWHGLGAVNGQALQSLVDQFNAQNAGKIHVDAVFQGTYDDLLAKYTASVKDGSSPTVMLAGDIASGYMRDVQRSMSPEAMAAANPGELNLDDLRPAARRYYSTDGHLMAVPMNTSTPVLWVNTQLLAQAGLPADVPLSSLDDVARVAKLVAQKTGQAGFVQAMDGWWFEQATAAAGAQYCAPDNGRGADGQPTAVAFDDPAQVAAFSTLTDIYTSGAGLDVGTDGNAAVAAFAAGKVALMFNSSGAAGAIAKSGMTGYTAARYPLSGDPRSSGTVVGGSALWLSATANDAQKVAGWKLESFLASAPAQEQFSQTTGYIPINIGVDSSSTEKSYLAAQPSAQVFLDQVNAVPQVPATAGCLTGAMTGIRKVIVSAMQSAFSGKTSVADALTTARAATADVLQQYRDQLGG
ncbi:extracellular solute-binding protein [Microbacterium sp. VKM Ac-2870]|uniref:extracellular solute-binding protein n=1 Tax=Microbacterium sp. VKM Ac-2870 TaxID=2783825 RepID=UPI00188D75C7|nr:extracellular solute-binding protein [Microbacterium sp. VKM Ac-2870]MBF4561938.1 extracellular solute-binding protein [Microbacterium sp. VKM Ac-2870]